MWFREDKRRTFVILLWVTWHDQFRDCSSSLPDKLEKSGCLVTSFSGARLGDDLNFLQNFLFLCVFCLSYGTFRNAVVSLALCLLSGAECIHLNCAPFLNCTSVTLAVVTLVVVNWPRHLSCYGFSFFMSPFPTVMALSAEMRTIICESGVVKVLWWSVVAVRDIV